MNICLKRLVEKQLNDVKDACHRVKIDEYMCILPVYMNSVGWLLTDWHIKSPETTTTW